MRKLTANEIEIYKSRITNATLVTDLVLLMQEFGQYQGDDTYRELLELAKAKHEQLQIIGANKTNSEKHVK